MSQIHLFSVLILAVVGFASKGLAATGPSHGKLVVCYFASWSIYRPNQGKFQLSDLDPSLCTHMVYVFAGLDEKTMTVKSLDPSLDTGGKYANAGYIAFTDLKIRYPHLKTLIGIGGWNEGSSKYSKMANSNVTRAQFIASVLLFLDNYKFDGIDMHWKFPTSRGGNPEDKENFVLLLKELKEAFTPGGYMLISALAAEVQIVDESYNLPELNRYLDLVILLAYNYYAYWDGVVGANAPLQSFDGKSSFSVDYLLKYMLAGGIDVNKLVLGMPMFGRNFILQDPDIKDVVFVSTPVEDDGFTAPYTMESGFMTYLEVCEEIARKDSNWTVYWHEQSSTPWARNGARVISYDNARSIAIKVKKAMEYNLPGVMVWTMDMDDFRGSCDLEPEYVSISASNMRNFIQKYSRLANNPILQSLLDKLNLPDARELENLNKYTELAHSKNNLWQVESKPTNYVLLRTIDESLTLALEEKRLVDNIINNVNDKATLSSPNNASSLFTVVCLYCFI